MSLLFVPILLGAVLLALRPLRENEGARTAYVTVALLVNTALALRVIVQPEFGMNLWHLTSDLAISLHMDALSRVFIAVTAALWLLAGLFSFGYLKGDKRAGVFFGVYLMVFGTMMGIECSANLVTLYLFYELMTLVSSLLVFYTGSHEAMMAGLKYLFYSIGGAFLALVGIFYLTRMNEGLHFRAGGVALYTGAVGGDGVLLVIVFLMLVGLGAKAGMYPLHGWLPTAHPVAPAPASAVLSGLIVKAGVFFSIRVVYYIVGADFLRGTWVQYAWMTLSLLTVFMGSMLAYLEPVLKKRLAYSTVSQVSYILFGLSLLTPAGLTGGLLHVIFHAVAKTGLFLAAGAYIVRTGKTRVDDLRGIGRAMPVTTACFAVFGLTLVGIPPFSGFVSKWYLATGAVNADVGAFGLIGSAILLISALLTAGYLFPLPVRGFFEQKRAAAKEAPAVMTAPLVLIAVLCLALGVCTGSMMDVLTPIVESLF